MIAPGQGRVRSVRLPPLRHGIHGIEHQVRQRAMEQLRSAAIIGSRIPDLAGSECDVDSPASELRLKQAHDAFHKLVDVACG